MDYRWTHGLLGFRNVKYNELSLPKIRVVETFRSFMTAAKSFQLQMHSIAFLEQSIPTLSKKNKAFIFKFVVGQAVHPKMLV